MNRPNVSGVRRARRSHHPELASRSTFNGYADAFDHPMKTVEFSMDGGETWTSFDVGGVDPAKVACGGASRSRRERRSVRAERARHGRRRRSELPATTRVLVNAKDEMPSGRRDHRDRKIVDPAIWPTAILPAISSKRG